MIDDELTLEEIQDALKKAENPWVAGNTSVSSLPLSEKKKLLGGVPPEGVLTKVMGKVEVIKPFGIPSAYDLRNVGGKDFVTPQLSANPVMTALPFRL